MKMKTIVWCRASLETIVVSLALAGGLFSVAAASIPGGSEGSRLASPWVSASADRADSSSVLSAEKAPNSRSMKITIGDRVFTATLQDNATASAFKALLPLSLNMHDVNRNEKAFDLSSDLPTADANPRTINAGDLMIWSSRTVVVFYKSFPTSYSYTRLGRIDDPSGLAEALGAGNVTVIFELK